jgi:hypothetical protein
MHGTVITSRKCPKAEVLMAQSAHLISAFGSKADIARCVGHWRGSSARSCVNIPPGDHMPVLGKVIDGNLSRNRRNRVLGDS